MAQPLACPSYDQAFSDVVRYRRTQLDISQTRLARLVGRDRQTVNRIENSRHSWLLSRLWRLAEVLQVPLFVLVREAEALALDPDHVLDFGVEPQQRIGAATR